MTSHSTSAVSTSMHGMTEVRLQLQNDWQFFGPFMLAVTDHENINKTEAVLFGFKLRKVQISGKKLILETSLQADSAFVKT